MDEGGLLSFESALIAVTAFSIVLGGMAGFKASQPQRWNELAVAASDVTRDLSWQAQQFAVQWKADPVAAIKTSLSDVPAPDVGPVTLRPAADPLAQVKALR